jgi:hypothetical protein
MYLNYELLSNGYRTIYLGETVPISSLKDLKKYFDNIVYVCYATVEPNKDEINNYIKEICTEVLDTTSQFWLIGRMTESVNVNNLNNKISIIKSLQEFAQKI